MAKGLTHCSGRGARDKGADKRSKEVGSTEQSDGFNMAPRGIAGCGIGERTLKFV